MSRALWSSTTPCGWYQMCQERQRFENGVAGPASLLARHDRAMACPAVETHLSQLRSENLTWHMVLHSNCSTRPTCKEYEALQIVVHGEGTTRDEASEIAFSSVRPRKLPLPAQPTGMSFLTS